MTGLYKVSSEVIRLWSWQKIKHGMYERAGVGTYIGLQDSVKLRFILGVKLGYFRISNTAYGLKYTGFVLLGVSEGMVYGTRRGAYGGFMVTKLMDLERIKLGSYVRSELFSSGGSFDGTNDVKLERVLYGEGDKLVI